MPGSIGKFLGVIPARGGSKSVPKKNIRTFLGEPLLVRAIRSAKSARLLTDFVVSTDDNEIATIAERAGAKVVIRPPELAQDHSRTEEALIHALDSISAASGTTYEAVVTLEPTSPFRTAALIDRCLTEFQRAKSPCLFTVAETTKIYGRLEGDVFMPLFPGQPRRRQEREPLFFESSTVYVTAVEHLLARRSVICEQMAAVVASEIEAFDINSPEDFAMAEALASLQKESSAAP